MHGIVKSHRSSDSLLHSLNLQTMNLMRTNGKIIQMRFLVWQIPCIAFLHVLVFNNVTWLDNEEYVADTVPSSPFNGEVMPVSLEDIERERKRSPDQFLTTSAERSAPSVSVMKRKYKIFSFPAGSKWLNSIRRLALQLWIENSGPCRLWPFNADWRNTWVQGILEKGLWEGAIQIGRTIFKLYWCIIFYAWSQFMIILVASLVHVSDAEADDAGRPKSPKRIQKNLAASCAAHSRSFKRRWTLMQALNWNVNI